MSEVRLDIKDILFNIDKKNYDWFDGLTNDEKASFNPFIVMQYISSHKNDSYYLEMSNMIINKDFSQKSKNKELFYRLCCVVGTGEKTYHPYMKPPKAGRKILSLKASLISNHLGEIVTEDEARMFIIKNKKLYNSDFWTMIAESMEWSKDDISKLESELKPIYKD